MNFDVCEMVEFLVGRSGRRERTVLVESITQFQLLSLSSIPTGASSSSQFSSPPAVVDVVFLLVVR